MGTRAVYSFSDDKETYHVYKHWDGYPQNALQCISFAKDKAWKLPRFEPDEFAASFVAANKHGEGDIRLTQHYNKHGDLDYRYEVRLNGAGILHVKIYEIGYGKPEKLEAAGYLDDLLKHYVKKSA